ncbi:patatin-like phospholipase family protein [Petropleomorpha daqingensis]|uniref:NTE family protein n=1 Tax=Petropleomorpha daqingensis TaxID=2026353 RepID=A0A853CKH4_9ACTN|nr:patatin-like phospholipase family protein [Petropleomorpha daqingensis]NYJ08067.1 NTE family protein [Petropleomorpha daqingensis]
MNATPSSSPHVSSTTARERALVLGGGGSSGNAWSIGVLAGLFEAGLDVTGADLVIGTSAGATTAAQITSAPVTDLYAATLAAPPPRRPGGAPGPIGSLTDHLERTNRIIEAAEDAADMRRRMGAAAIELAAASNGGSARWRETVAARLPDPRWPERAVHITVVDAHTGEPLVLDRDSGVELVDAVAASTAGGPAYLIGDRWYIDGGYRSVDNADLAAGYRRVLVLSPLGGRSRHPREWGTYLAAQVDELRAGGSRVETVLPDSNALDAFGENMMDPSRRPLAARAGHDQGRALAEQLTEGW